MKRLSVTQGVQVHSSIDPIEEAWDQLAAREHAPPFLTPGWHQLWNRAFAESSHLQIFALHHGDDLAAVLPLQLRKGCLRSPTNWHTPEFDLLAEDEAAAEELLAAIFAQNPHILELRFIPAQGRAAAVIRSVAAGYGFSLSRRIVSSPAIKIEGEWEQYESNLSRNLRGDVRRRLRRLKEAGEVDLDIVTGGDRLDEALAEAFDIEASGWKGRAATAIASHPSTLRFYSDLARWAESRGELRLSFLRLDGAPIAFQFGLEAHGIYYNLKVGYLEAIASLSPGKVHLRFSVEQAFRSRLSEYSFLGADDAYKNRWATDWHDLLEFKVFSRSARGVVHWAIDRYCKPLARRARASISRQASR